MTRYYAVEPCEHGSVQAHAGGIVEVNEYTHSTSPDWCPGGSRRRVRIDYEAAAKMMWRVTGEVDGQWPTLWESHTRHMRNQSRSIVDAALVTEEGT